MTAAKSITITVYYECIITRVVHTSPPLMNFLWAKKNSIFLHTDWQFDQHQQSVNELSLAWS